MDVKGESTLKTFQQKQVKKWDQSVSRAKCSLYIVKLKKVGLVPLYIQQTVILNILFIIRSN